MKKVMKKIFLGISAIVSIAVVSKIVGHPPKGVEQFILYAFPGGILMFFIFDPLLKAFSSRTEGKSVNKSESIREIHHVTEKPAPQRNNLFDETESPASVVVKSIKLTEQDDAARGISVLLVALRWDSNPLSKQKLRDRAAKAVQLVDSQFDKNVMDVKILVIDESQQYVQLSVRADFRDKSEEEQMREALKRAFIK
jgi:hypothetical protein